VRFGTTRWALVAAVAAATCVVPASAGAAKKKKPVPAPAVSGVAAAKSTVAPRARVAVVATATNRADRRARVSVSFYASADGRRDRKDIKLGSARTARLQHDKSGRAKLTVRLPAAVRAGSWTLFACSGAGRRVVCAKAKRKLVVKAAAKPAVPAAPARPSDVAPPVRPAAPPAPPAPPAPALTLQVAGDWEWGWYQVPDGHTPEPGDTLTTTLRLGAAVAGQAGYGRTTMPAAAAVTGRETVLIDASQPLPPDANHDDWSIPVSLPFAIPFAGVATTQLAVSTNGWLATASPAFAYYPAWMEDYRGPEAVLGSHLAAIAPLLGDLSLEGPNLETGRIVLVEPADGESLAIRWEVFPLNGPDDERSLQVFEAVLFRDGRVRFDYLQRPAFSADLEHTIGISPGVSGRLPDVTFSRETVAPADSILFTPHPLTSSTAAAAGSASLTLPRGSAFAGADPGCALAQAPTPLADGRVDCAVPSVAAGSTSTATISWTYPPAFVGVVDQTATWNAGGMTETSAVELADDAFGDAAATTFTLTPQAMLHAGLPGVTLQTEDPARGARLHHPRLTVEVPPGLTVASVSYDGEELSDDDLAAVCGTLPPVAAGGSISCTLPNGMRASTMLSILFDTVPLGGDFPLSFTLSADNMPAPAVRQATLSLPT
jgi:hypothetical protein